MRLPLGVLAAALSLAGCGDDAAPAAQRGSGRASAAPAPASEAAAKKDLLGGIDPTKVPAKYRTLDWVAEDELDRSVRDTRDPFQAFADEVEVKGPIDGPPDIVGGVPVEWNELQLSAIITGTAIHKALMVDSRGVGHVVRAGEIVGRQEPKRVTRITRNEVVAKPLIVKPGAETGESVKRLLTDEELDQLEEL